MPNKNYIKGRKKEYKLVHQLKDEGWDIVQRTAGSHSPVDIIAINKKLRVIRLIQAKPDNYPQSQEDKILSDNSWLNNVYRVEFVVE